MSSYCHWSCPQTLASATPLGESTRSISHVTNQATDQSFNDCDKAPGWYYFPGTRMVIKDVDGLPPADSSWSPAQLGRCGAQSGLMHMLYSSELPQLGAAKASVSICTGACSTVSLLVHATDA